MSKIIEIETAIINLPSKNNTDVFSIEIADESVTQDVLLEYVSPADGGPLMRPKNPPM